MDIHNIPFQYKNITINFPNSEAIGFLVGLKNEFKYLWQTSHRCSRYLNSTVAAFALS